MLPLLEALVAVYECRQFTLAAYELRVSQSTVSARIAQLEHTVGVAVPAPSRGALDRKTGGGVHRWRATRRSGHAATHRPPV